jgi:hypothetical protein
VSIVSAPPATRRSSADPFDGLLVHHRGKSSLSVSLLFYRPSALPCVGSVDPSIVSSHIISSVYRSCCALLWCLCRLRRRCGYFKGVITEGEVYEVLGNERAGGQAIEWLFGVLWIWGEADRGGSVCMRRGWGQQDGLGSVYREC